MNIKYVKEKDSPYKAEVDYLKKNIKTRKRLSALMKIHLVLWGFLLVYLFTLSINYFGIGLVFFLLELFLYLKERNNIFNKVYLVQFFVGLVAACFLNFFQSGLHFAVLFLISSPVLFVTIYDEDNIDVTFLNRTTKEVYPLLRRILESEAYEVYVNALKLKKMNDQVSSLYELLDIYSSLDSSSSNYEASRVELTNLMLNIIKEMKAEEELQEKEEDKVANVYNDSLLEDAKEIAKGDNSYD